MRRLDKDGKDRNHRLRLRERGRRADHVDQDGVETGLLAGGERRLFHALGRDGGSSLLESRMSEHAAKDTLGHANIKDDISLKGTGLDT